MPRLLLLDELDHYLHPKAQFDLVRQFRALTEGCDDLQLVATTHSPYELDAFTLAEVRVFAPRPKGSWAEKELPEHSTAQRLRDVQPFRPTLEPRRGEPGRGDRGPTAHRACR